ncbi:MAG: hypothetical protein LBL94_08210 [Prevotellaceae bacterium]|jgi:hypothetical protein|nr:hypothetical protein [Prevotellaceae bacterium]
MEENIEQEIAHMKSRILTWLSPENLAKAKGKTKAEIIAIFGNKLQPVSYIPLKFLLYVGADINDNRVYSGMGYFIDHAVNHHPNILAEKYANVQTFLNNPDDIKETTKERNRSVIFIKKTDRYNAVLVHTKASEVGKIILHTSFFSQSKKPYARLPSIRSTSLEDGIPSISPADNTAAGRSLSARKDDVKVQQVVGYPK